MAIRTLTETLDNLYTTTWRNIKTEIVDNIFDATPFWFWLRASKGFESKIGGRSIDVNLSYAKSDNIVWLAKGATVAMDDKEILTTANYNWRYVADSVVRFWQDEQKNRGKSAVLNMVNAKLANSRDSLVDEMETRLFGAQSGILPNGLQDLVADDPTTGTVGGIDASVYTWWQSKTKNMTGLSFAVQGVAQMRTMLNNVSNNKGNAMPDILVSGQTPFEYYEDDVLEQKRIVNKTLGDAGFENIQFKGKPLIWSPACANTRMYFINTNHLKFWYDPAFLFEMTNWKEIPNQPNDRAAQIVLAGNLGTDRRRAHGVLFNIDTQ